LAPPRQLSPRDQLLCVVHTRIDITQDENSKRHGNIERQTLSHDTTPTHPHTHTPTHPHPHPHHTPTPTPTPPHKIELEDHLAAPSTTGRHGHVQTSGAPARGRAGECASVPTHERTNARTHARKHARTQAPTHGRTASSTHKHTRTHARTASTHALSTREHTFTHRLFAVDMSMLALQRFLGVLS
jgi:hypothetical protein